LGVSDRPYFAWLGEALASFERGSREISAIGAGGGPVELWVLAGARMNPALELVRDALGRDRTTIRFLDRFERGPGVIAADFNALGRIADEGCDVLVMTRASYMIEDPEAFLAGARRLLRPGGLMIVDWLHGSAEAPRLDLPGQHEYDGHPYDFCTTYCDADCVAEFPMEFGALIAHVNRPPAWVNLDRPGAPVPTGERVRRLLGGGPRREVNLATYLSTLREDLSRAGKHLVEPGDLAPHFKIVFRHARYMYPRTGKFYLHLLTALRPAGK